MKDNVLNDPLRHVYDDFVATVTRHANGPPVADIPVFHHIQSQMKRAKYKNVPPIPEDVDNVVINGVWAETWDNQGNIIHQDNGWGIMVFGTDQNLRFIRHARTIFADGIFRSCPRQYNQIFTIHALVRDYVVLLATCLTKT